MRSCPNCLARLERTTYEGQVVWKCGDCAGYLIASPRIEFIRKRTDVPLDELLSESLRTVRTEPREIQCPACLAWMDRRMTGGPLSIEIDCCRSCDLVWLDPGEIEIGARARRAVLGLASAPRA